MFKPSLKKSVLNNNLCPTTLNQYHPFTSPDVQKLKPVLRFADTLPTSQIVVPPSIMIPEEILQKHQFHNQNNYTHIFTPLAYDFQPYPPVVKQKISSNPKAAQAGRINHVNFVIFQQQLILWRAVNHEYQQQILKIHDFKQPINIATFSVIQNETIFKKQAITVLAISFENRVKLYRLNEDDLSLEDMMIKYQVKSCRYIQKIYFTQQNEIVIAGDSGQFCMISLNGSSSVIVKVQSSVIKKYLSKSAFDYSARHLVREIQVSSNFVYCLHDRISKSNYLMYFLKKAINKVVMLSEEPKYIKEETFVDVYKFTNENRNELVFLTQLKQNDIQKKIKEGYVNFWGEGVKDPFRIVAINSKGQQNLVDPIQAKPFINSSEKTANLSNPLIEITTKCGYIISLIHESSVRNGQQGNQENFSFAAQPTKLPSKIGQASLFEPKVFISAPQQKEYRKSYVIKSLPLSKNEKMILMNDSLMFSNKQEISMIGFDDLKSGIYDTTTLENNYLTEEEFNQLYQPYKVKNASQSQGIFGQRVSVYNVTDYTKSNNYIRLFNNQRRWTCFDNEGCFHIYPLEVKHILLAYLFYQCEFNGQNSKSNQQFDQKTNFLIESDLRLHSTIEKVIRLYGYTAFMRALVEILTNNSSNQREYFYLQRNLFLEVIKRDFEYELANAFEDWSYSLTEKDQAQKIVPTDKMLQLVWLTLFEHQNKSVLTSETIYSQNPVSEYALRAKEYQEAKNQIEYTAYGYALKSIFFEIIEILIYFRAKEFKKKEAKLKICRTKLVNFFNFLQMKKLKSESQEYKLFIDLKLTNLSRKKEFSQQYPNKNLNTTLSTTLNSTNQSLSNIDEETNTSSAKRGVTQQANDTLEKNINSSIQKIISLIDVMNILIEKDERQGLPNFIEIVTSFKNQIKIGEQFFKEELFFSSNNVEFIHPELVKQVDAALPELHLQMKIDFLKFKLAKNIATNNSLNEVDLKSLDFKKLSELVTSSEISEIKKMFLGEGKEVNCQRTYFFMQFLSISLSRTIQKVGELANFKQQKFKSLWEEKNSSKSKLSALAVNATIEKIITSEQQLEFYQEETVKFFEEIKKVLTEWVNGLKTIKGSMYYEAERYLDRMIELVTTNFGGQEVMYGMLEGILREGNLFEKVHYMKQVRSRMMHLKEGDVQILRVAEEKERKLEEKSTFQYLKEIQGKKSFGGDRTRDTMNTDSTK